MKDALYFHNIRGGILKIDVAPLQRMHNYIQDAARKKEAGGVLLGRFIIDSKDVVVDEVTVPMPGDKRSRFRFFRKSKRHQAVIDHVWTKSERRVNYLGGWHTHPEPIPSFSRIDVIDWKKALRCEQFDSETLYFIVVGTEQVCVWEGIKRTCNISQLDPIH
jgi:integrative and conjugative element protein (TIGR02256 family)